VAHGTNRSSGSADASCSEEASLSVSDLEPDSAGSYDSSSDDDTLFGDRFSAEPDVPPAAPVMHCGGLPLPAQGVKFVGYTPGVGHGEVKYSEGRGSVGTITV